MSFLRYPPLPPTQKLMVKINLLNYTAYLEIKQLKVWQISKYKELAAITAIIVVKLAVIVTVITTKLYF